MTEVCLISPYAEVWNDLRRWSRHRGIAMIVHQNDLHVLADYRDPDGLPGILYGARVEFVDPSDELRWHEQFLNWTNGVSKFIDLWQKAAEPRYILRTRDRGPIILDPHMVKRLPERLRIRYDAITAPYVYPRGRPPQKLGRGR